MSMINCKECGKEISSEACTCPHCGAHFHDQAAKDYKWVAILLILLISIIIGSYVGEYIRHKRERDMWNNLLPIPVIRPNFDKMNEGIKERIEERKSDRNHDN